MSNVIERAIAWALCVAGDDSHGYSQDANKRFAGVDYDCSSFVISAFKQAGLDLKSTYTGNMKQDFLAHGFVEVPLKDKQRGDVLLNEAHHTALYIGDNKIVHASSSETGGKYGREGDQTGREICVRSYYEYPWNCVLRYVGDGAVPTPSTESKGDKTVMVEVRQLQYGSKGADVKTLQIILNEKAQSRHLVVDGDFGSNTKNAVMDFQRKFGVAGGADGIVGKNTWDALINR